MIKKFLIPLCVVFVLLSLISCENGANIGKTDNAESISQEENFSVDIGNTVNGGYAVEYGNGYLFGGNKDGGGLYFRNGESNEKLTDGLFRSMTLVGNELYYTNDRPGYIQKLSLDTMEKESVVHTLADSLTVYGNTLYYRTASLSSFGKICSVDISTEDKTSKVIAEGALNFCISGNRIYYCNMVDGNTLWSAALDGTDKKRISDMYALSLVCDSEYLYLSDFNDGLLKSYRISDGKVQVLTDETCRNLTLSEGIIYFVNRSDNSSLYSIKTDGSDITKLADGIADEVVAIKGRVFFEREEEELVNTESDGEGELIRKSLGYYVINLDTMTEKAIE